MAVIFRQSELPEAGRSFEMRFIVPIPLTGGRGPTLRGIVQLTNDIQPAPGNDVAIAIKNIGAPRVEFERPLARFIHANESAPVPVPLLFEVPVAVAKRNHLHGLQYGG